MSPRRITRIVCVALVCAAAFPASAGAIGATASFQVSLEGEVRESWNYWQNADGYVCEPRFEGHGTAVARFKSPGSAKLRVNDYRGFGGRVPVDVTVERQGFRQRTSREEGCTDEPPQDASRCGTISYRASATGFAVESDKWGFGIPGDRNRWKGACPLAEDPLPAHDLDPLRMLGRDYGGPFSWQHKLLRSRSKTYVLKVTRHVVLPYSRSEFGGTQGGEYVADVSYTVKFRRTSKVTG